MDSNNVSVVCKKCKQSAPASQFSMHLEEGIMVCPRCIAGRKAKTEADFLAKQRKVEATKQNSGNQSSRSFQGIPIVNSRDDDENPTVDRLGANKPAGWDAEDEYLMKLSKQKEKNQPQIEAIMGDSLSLCTCKKCSYKFKYDHRMNKPSKCPYCSFKVY